MRPHEQLEHDWAEFNGLCPDGMVACSSGTAALHLALEAWLPGGGGQRVVVPDYTMVACARAVTLAGMVPAFADCDDRLLMRGKDALRIAYGVNAPAVMAVHVYGRKIDRELLSAIAQGSLLIEDMAELHGQPPHKFASAACWSFYANKVVGGEEGGAVWFADYDVAAKARSLRSLGFTEGHDYLHAPRGHNYRLADSLATLVLGSLSKYPLNRAMRRHAEEAYDEALPAEFKMPPRDVPWVYDVRVPGLTYTAQAAVVRGLNAAGVAARMGFKPMSLQREYCGTGAECAEKATSNAHRLAPQTLYLPLMSGKKAVTRGEAVKAVELLKTLADAAIVPA